MWFRLGLARRDTFDDRGAAEAFALAWQANRDRGHVRPLGRRELVRLGSPPRRRRVRRPGHRRGRRAAERRAARVARLRRGVHAVPIRHQGLCGLDQGPGGAPARRRPQARTGSPSARSARPAPATWPPPPATSWPGRAAGSGPRSGSPTGAATSRRPSRPSARPRPSTSTPSWPSTRRPRSPSWPTWSTTPRRAAAMRDQALELLVLAERLDLEKERARERRAGGRPPERRQRIGKAEARAANGPASKHPGGNGQAARDPSRRRPRREGRRDGRAPGRTAPGADPVSRRRWTTSRRGRGGCRPGRRPACACG